MTREEFGAPLIAEVRAIDRKVEQLIARLREEQQTLHEIVGAARAHGYDPESGSTVAEWISSCLYLPRIASLEPGVPLDDLDSEARRFAKALLEQKRQRELLAGLSLAGMRAAGGPFNRDRATNEAVADADALLARLEE